MTELVGLGAELGDAAPEAAQRWVGGLGGIGEAVRVGPQPSAHGGLSLQGPAGVELLTQRSRSSDEQIADLGDAAARALTALLRATLS